MALHHILQAISQLAEQQRSSLQHAHDQQVATLLHNHELELATEQANIDHKFEKSLHALLQSAESQAKMAANGKMLQQQSVLLAQLYQLVLQNLESFNDQEVETFFADWIKQLPTTGTIYPAKKHASLLKKLVAGTKLTLDKPLDASCGGFKFENNECTIDCTFEFFVYSMFKPNTTAIVSKKLFVH